MQRAVLSDLDRSPEPLDVPLRQSRAKDKRACSRLQSKAVRQYTATATNEQH